MKKLSAVLLLCFGNLFAQQFISGIKLYPEYAAFGNKTIEFYKEKTEEMKKAGFNYIFTTPYNSGYAFYDSEFIPVLDTTFSIIEFVKALRANGLKFAAICQIFHDPASYEYGYYFKPVDSQGDSSQTGWQKFICPADTAYRNYKLRIINEILNELNPDMISLDFIRYPLEWEKISEEGETGVREFCFCSNCLNRFMEHTGFDYPADAVTDSSRRSFILMQYTVEYKKWRDAVITSFVKDVELLIQEQGGGAELSVHIIPWTADMYQRSMKYSGQSLEALSAAADYLSPMIYLDILNKEPDYISEYAQYYSGLSGVPMLPSLKVPFAGRTSIDTENLQKQIESVLENNAGGFVLFHYNDIFVRDREGESKLKNIVENLTNQLR